MSSLSGILAIANQSLQAQQGGLEVSANNIANVNTPGYTRQVALLAEQAPYAGSGGIGGGVGLQQIQGVRDSVLAIRINQETQSQASLASLQQQLNPVQSLFATQGGAGLGSAVDAFFNSLQQLSTDPTSGSQRQAVISAAQTMARTFQQVSLAISQQQSGANQGVAQAVTQANGLLAQIAGLNGQIADAQNSGTNTSALQDQRANLMGTLSGIIGFNTSDGGNGQLTLTTGQGNALVVGTEVTPLATHIVGGVEDVFSGATDISAGISGGSLAGLIQARDQILPGLASQLDQLASGIATRVNQQNQQGFDLTGAAGGNLFTPPPATAAAATLSLATTDPNAIAASADGTAGDNANLIAMEGLQQQPLAAGQNPDDAYAGMVSSLGSVIAAANTRQQASSTVLTQLQNQQSSTSGVSMDEESINLEQFQAAYQAAAKVVGVINTLTSLAINLGKD